MNIWLKICPKDKGAILKLRECKVCFFFLFLLTMDFFLMLTLDSWKGSDRGCLCYAMTDTFS